jgi:hypothetical protein
MTERQSQGRKANGAQPGDRPDASTPEEKVVETGRREQQSAGPDGPDAAEVGDTFKS